MTDELEAGAALVTAGLAAKQLDVRSKGAAAHHEEQLCPNCRQLATGHYCAACGQATHVHRSLWHMFEEVLHGVLHLDNKTWRTLPLLIARPGVLTRRYVEGQRVKYVSPMALFLFSIFLMFFVLSYFPLSQPINFKMPTNLQATQEQLQKALAESNAEIEEQRAALAAARTDEERKEAQEELDTAIAGQKVAQDAFNRALSMAEKARAAADAGNDPERAALNELLRDDASKSNNGVRASVRKAIENPELMRYKLKNTAYKFSFMLIPILMGFLWLVFVSRRDVKMYDHAIFSMYSLSFMSLFFALFAMLAHVSILSGRLNWLLLLPVLHIFMQLREAYGIGWRGTVWRTIVLLICSLLGFAAFLILVVAISMRWS